ncbi:MAG: hypothetical protein QNJ42_05805 [Crocosphaera sp.]|nr:hypothetical protein [Crocosphaera sp.]
MNNNSILKSVARTNPLPVPKKSYLKPPLAEAKNRGLKIKKQLLEAEGGCAKSKKISETLGMSPQVIDQRRQQGKLMGFSNEKGKYIYPLWQFTNKGETINGLEEVLEKLQDFDPWMQIAFFLNPNVRLNDKTPLEMLRMGEIEPVINSAIAFANDEPD